jgi:uncharacterized membrane protein
MDTGTVIVVLAFLATISGVVAFGRDTNSAIQKARTRPLSWYWARVKLVASEAAMMFVSGAGGLFTYGCLTLAFLLALDKDEYDNTNAILIFLVLFAISAVGSACVRKYIETSNESRFWKGFLLGSAIGVYYAIYLFDL